MGQIKIIIAMVLTIVMNLQSDFVFAETKVYVVYLGEKKHDYPESVTESHHQLLWPLMGSKKAVHDSIVYSYRHGFSGFAAKLTESQAQQLSEHPEVVHVIPNTLYQLTTTRTWDYLGLSPGNSKSLLHKANMGSQLIVGIIDSGVWPESEMFNDKGYGPIPSRWKGGCESGEHFNASIHCNRKLIGAKYFVNGLVAEIGVLNTTENPEYISPRDIVGHGTHVSSTIGGSFLRNVSYLGLGRGTVRGGAPGVHLAIYKACWNTREGCSGVDILKAIDVAIRDGVDVLSISLGPKVPIPLYPETDVKDAISVGAFHAVAKGIPVVAAAGNAGPAAQTICNVAPWILTVAATTLDRSFPTAITLGNNITILGQAIFAGPELGFVGLTYPGDSANLSTDPNNTMEGKVVLLFTADLSPTSTDVGDAITLVSNAGGRGVIIARNPIHGISPIPNSSFPCVTVDFELGTDILFYIRSTRSPSVKIHASRTLVSHPVATKVATFSSRGPNSISPAILKPDIGAPGVNILAATSLNDPLNDKGFVMMSGTSMATPVVSGVVVLLKSLYPEWSPAAIKSAIVTTAWKTDPSGEPIFADGSSRKLADPFDYGGGLINPEKAVRPGLIYDMTIHDYVFYLCSTGYNDTSISRVLEKKSACPNPKPSVLDLNLPSITIPNLRDKVTLTVTRTVTNVGPLNSVYKVMIDPPMGVSVTVTPETLVFDSTTKNASFKVTVSTMHKVNTGYYFGSLTWTDNLHNVVIPLSVRTQIRERYNDEN